MVLADQARLPLACTVLAGLAVLGFHSASMVFLGLALAGSVGLEPDLDPMTALWLALVASAVALVARMLRDIASAWTAETIGRRLRRQLLERLVDLGPGWLAGQRGGTVQTAVGDGIHALRGYVSAYLPQVAVTAVGVVALVVVALILDPVVGTVIAVTAALLPITKPLWVRLLGDRSQEHWMAYRTLSDRMQESLRGMASLKMLGAANARRAQIASDASRLFVTTRSGLMVSLVVFAVATMVVGLGTAAALGVAAVRVREAAADPVAMVVLVILVAEVLRPLLDLENYWASGFHGRAAYRGIAEILDAPPTLTGTTAPSAPQPPPIRIDHVGFSYPGAEVEALRDVDLEIEPGETIAVVGRSGAGKSTLVGLLLRWYDPDRGRILVGEQDLRDIDPVRHRSRIAVVSQDVHLFADSVADNLRLAAPDATESELWSALERAQAAELVSALPEGIQTPLGERGARLSGGERQRIALARALLADAPLLILDEATAALDGRTEAAVVATVEEFRRGRTTIVIAHRLSTLLDADRVVVLDGGRVAQVGAPAELLDGAGMWRDLVTAQAGAR